MPFLVQRGLIGGFLGRLGIAWQLDCQSGCVFSCHTTLLSPVRIRNCTYPLVANFKLSCVLEYGTKNARAFRILRSQQSPFSMTATYVGEHWNRTICDFSTLPKTTSNLSFYLREATVQVRCPSTSFLSASQLILELKEYQISGDPGLTDSIIVCTTALPPRLK